MAEIINFSDIVPLDNEDCECLVFTRSLAFYEIAERISNLIKSLPISVDDNNKLVALMVQQVEEAECCAFHDGVNYQSKKSK